MRDNDDHRSRTGGCLLCGLTDSVGTWSQHVAGKRHRAAAARAGNVDGGAAGGDAPPPAKKPKLSDAAAAPKAAPKAVLKAPAPRPRSPSPPRMTQTDACAEFCLSKKDVETLTCRLAVNPHHRRGPPMKLFLVHQLRALAEAKHGSLAGVAAAKAKNASKAAKAAATRAHNDGWRVGANPSTWSPATHRSFTPQFRAAVREFMLCAHRLQLFGGADSFATLSQRVVKLMVEAVPPRANQLAKPVRPPRARYYRGYDDYPFGDDYDDMY